MDNDFGSMLFVMTASIIDGYKHTSQLQSSQDVISDMITHK